MTSPGRGLVIPAASLGLVLLEDLVRVERFGDALKHRIRCRERLLCVVQRFEHALLIEAVPLRSKPMPDDVFLKRAAGAIHALHDTKQLSTLRLKAGG